ncbi:MAG: TetR family transcriptional regulator [Thermoleophilaceae bacterium]|nr:TetR family transcriptional regulator [Thermoleophilaceae bacterium]
MSEPTPTPAEPAREAGEGRREAILRAALRLIGRRGLHAVTHRDVAAEAGVPLASTTYYFASKDDLLTEALWLFVREEVQRLERAAASFEGLSASPEEVADAMVEEVRLTLQQEAEQVAQFELYLQASRNPRLAAAAREAMRAYERTTAAALRAAGARDPEGWAPLFQALGRGLIFEQLVERRERWAEEILRPALLTLFRALQ